MSTYQMVSRHVEAALAEASKQGIADDVVARCLLSEAIRIFRSGRPIDDIAAELREIQRGFRELDDRPRGARVDYCRELEARAGLPRAEFQRHLARVDAAEEIVRQYDSQRRIAEAVTEEERDRREREFQALGLLCAYWVLMHALMSMLREYFDPLWPLLAAALQADGFHAALLEPRGPGRGVLPVAVRRVLAVNAGEIAGMGHVDAGLLAHPLIAFGFRHQSFILSYSRPPAPTANKEPRAVPGHYLATILAGKLIFRRERLCRPDICRCCGCSFVSGGWQGSHAVHVMRGV